MHINIWRNKHYKTSNGISIWHGLLLKILDIYSLKNNLHINSHRYDKEKKTLKGRVNQSYRKIIRKRKCRERKRNADIWKKMCWNVQYRERTLAQMHSTTDTLPFTLSHYTFGTVLRNLLCINSPVKWSVIPFNSHKHEPFKETKINFLLQTTIQSSMTGMVIYLP